MADDAAVLIGIGAIVIAGVGIWWLARRQQALGGGGGLGGLFGDGSSGGGPAPVPAVGNCIDTVGTDGSPITCFGTVCNGRRSSVCGARGTSCANLRALAVRDCQGAGMPMTMPKPVNCGDCNHLNCAGVRACINQCPPFNQSILNACGVQNIGGSIITGGTGGTGGRPTTGGAILPCIVDEATNKAKCGGNCSCSASWFYQGTNTPCQPTGAEVAARRDQCGLPGGSVTPGFDIEAGVSHPTVGVHRPWYNRVFYNPSDQMRLVIAS
jgi:hypothetical protein